MNKLRKITDSGFTLVELLVTLAIASILMAGIYKVYHAQMRSQVAQNAVRDTQEDLRSAFFFIERSLRMAGFDPNRGARTTMPDELGILPDLSYFGHAEATTSFADANTKSRFKSIAFTLNANGDKDPPGVTGCGSPVSSDCSSQIDGNDAELVAYRFDKASGRIQKYQVKEKKWWTVAFNVEDMYIEFFCDDGADPDNPIDADDDPDLIQNFDKNSDGKPDLDKIARIRLARITIKAKPLKEQVKFFSSDDKPYVISSMVRVRNVGLGI
ncbi:MAG: prepilin-type N-terminal cleavage/methylation domain-containing protein [Desulfobacterales bacterium]|jgi:prepilin-type N-terminal cleavage/methylation domain-containing protein|nr:prepilin-type N-terminal cleavage/methylation domain-containing protein [Desulfobacterales bacterium]